MLPNEEINIKFRMKINKYLYDEHVIELDVYQQMENFLINKLSKINGR